MENLKEQLCLGLPHFCSAGMQAPQLAVKPESKTETEHILPTRVIDKQKPWSVFAGVYWI